MKSRPSFFAVAMAALCMASSSAWAGFTTVDISTYLNGNVLINTAMFPVGLGQGNTGTGIPFETYSYGSNHYMGSVFLQGTSSPPGASSTVTIDLSTLAISGEASFYALLNNYYGTTNADEYTVTIKFSSGGSESYSSIGGVNTRDYNQNPSTDNTIANTTTNWWTNEATQGPTGYQRLDVREFSIAPAYQSDTISSFQITQLIYNDPAFLSGLTFSTSAAQVLTAPEPATFAVFGVGMAGIALVRRRRGLPV